jgi:predicted amidohydrolase
MNVALIQSPLIWESPDQNLSYFQAKINSLDQNIDLIVLPEMFTTGFTMQPALVAETMDGITVNWMIKMAKERNLAITGSIVILENKHYYNRLLFVFPDGALQFYDKRHLFTLAGEDKAYAPGSQKLIVDYLGWRICPLICYDLRFPVFARNTETYDLLIFVANWPKSRINAWDILLQARAIENMSYVIGVNRTGEDANKNQYPGHSQVLDYLGNYLVEPLEKEGVSVVFLDKQKMLETRAKLGFLNDKDTFEIKRVNL